MNFKIPSITSCFDKQIQAKIDGKTKPLGALGELESVAKLVAKVQYRDVEEVSSKSLVICNPTLIVFAGDHGIAAEGVSIAPSEVTGQMVANFASGGAAINVFCRQFNWQLKVVDAGILQSPDPELGVINQRLGCSTEPFNKCTAMSMEQVEEAFKKAETLVDSIAKSGTNIIAFGEMGIGNTTSASAIMSALTDFPVAECVGKGTGVSDEVVLKKQQVIEQAIALHGNALSSPEQILACLGGFEIAQITGAMLASAKRGMLIVVDGFICTAAAMLAISINKNARDYMIFSHCSGEQGHQKMLDWLEVKPLLNLGLRLGEGTGAALSLPLIQASVNFYNEMASFAQAEVTDVT